MNWDNAVQRVLFVLHFITSSTISAQSHDNFNKKCDNKNSSFCQQEKNASDSNDRFDNNYQKVQASVNQNFNWKMPVYQYADPTKNIYYQSQYEYYKKPEPQQGNIMYRPILNRRVESNGEEMKMGWMSHEMKSKGGWKPEQKYIHHKKKKGKKGVLSKIVKKFKRGKKKQPLIWKEEPECDGFENFIKDLEIIAWITGWIGFGFATVAFILHILNQIYGFFSVVIVGLPERLTTFVDLIAPGTTPEMLRIILASLGLLDYVTLFFASYPLGNVIVVVDSLAEIFTLFSLSVGTITIFDDLVEEKIWAIFGVDVHELFESYGCDNPFSKEKKIEQLFEAISGKLSGESKKKRNKAKGGEKHKGWSGSHIQMHMPGSEGQSEVSGGGGGGHRRESWGQNYYPYYNHNGWPWTNNNMEGI